MKYSYKYIEENVNVSKGSPVAELFILVSGALAVILTVYFLSGFFIGQLALSLPPDMQSKIETKLAESLNYSLNDKPTSNYSENERLLQNIVDDIAYKNPDLSSNKYKINVVKNDEVNAFAIPGRKIVVTSSLIKEVNSINGLKFVVAHELGHFANRDHLKSIGRQLILISLSNILLGEDNKTTDFLVNSMQNLNMKFSQQQELNADKWAVDALYKKYHEISGPIDFLEKIKKKDHASQFAYFFATHPYPEYRIKVLKGYIKRKGYQ